MWLLWGLGKWAKLNIHIGTATAKRKLGKVRRVWHFVNCLRVELNMKSICHSWVTLWKQTCVPDLASLAMQGGILKGWPQFFGLFDPLPPLNAKWRHCYLIQWRQHDNSIKSIPFSLTYNFNMKQTWRTEFAIHQRLESFAKNEVEFVI